jgi:hypothetical protein
VECDVLKAPASEPRVVAFDPAEAVSTDHYTRTDARVHCPLDERPMGEPTGVDDPPALRFRQVAVESEREDETGISVGGEVDGSFELS